MRIAHLTWSLGIGGIQTMLTEIANIQIQKGHEVGIFVIDTYVSETIVNKLDPRVKVFYMGRIRGTKPIWPFIKLNWQLWKYKPDIIHSHASWIIKALLTTKPSVATIHTTNSKLSDFNHYKYICAISKTVQQEWAEKYGKTPILIENGINCNNIKTKKDNNKTNEIHLVQLSRISIVHKGQDIVVRGFKLLLEKLHNEGNVFSNKIFLHFIGDGIDFEKLKNLVSELRLDDYVYFEGFKDPKWIHEHLCDYNLFIQASRHEGFGLTVAEACAAKIPVLVSNIQGPLEIIDGGKLGMTFKCGDYKDLSDKLYEFVCNGYDQQKVEDAYNYTCEHYDIRNVTEKYIELYNKVIQE